MNKNEGRSGIGGIIQPKVKHKIRVLFANFGNQPVGQYSNLTVNIVKADTPLYVGGVWCPFVVTVNDDITNDCMVEICAQISKQFQPSNFRFDVEIQTLDGGSDTIVGSYKMYGCHISECDFGDFDYTVDGEKRIIKLTIAPTDVVIS